jgi:hypothetical protein
MAGTAREEAERLVATALAMAGRSGLGGGATGGWATGSAECCVCPVCRVIAGLRDPHPMTAERLATGAGDVATGVASLLRAVSAVAGGVRAATERPPAERRPATPTSERPKAAAFNPDTTWSAATRTADAEPAHAGTADAEPAAAQPADAEPAAAQPADAEPAPAQPAQAQPAQAQPAQAQPGEAASAAGAPRAGERADGDVWAAATGDHGASGTGTVDHDGAGA